MLIIRNLKKCNASGFFKAFLILALCVLGNISSEAQNSYVITHNDSLALENVIVEKYYKVTSKDCQDTTGGILPKGSVVYRIYIDLKPGYFLQTVYGNEKHELFLKTSTTFFNNLYCNAITGYNISQKEINENTVALDSWITLGAASRLHTGILRSEDQDGSILNRPEFGKTDGLTNGILPTFKQFNLDLNFFNDRKNASVFSTSNGGWAALEGVKGPTSENRILIAQLTTNGKLSFQLNIQIGTPTKGSLLFVANNPEGSEILNKCLTR
jgi:hypothetical protein